MAKPVDPLCQAYQAAMEVLGRPWTALILAILQDGPLRFGELRERAKSVGDKTLCARLRELEQREIITRDVDQGPPVRVSYALTPKGEAFRQVSEAIERWGRELVRDAPPTKRLRAPPRSRYSRARD